MIHIVILAPDGTMVTRDLAKDPPAPNECPAPGCGGELIYMVRSSYFQYRTIDDDGRVDDTYHTCNDAIGETLETWLECHICFAQPKHKLEVRVIGTVTVGGKDDDQTEEYVSFEEGSPPCDDPPS